MATKITPFSYKTAAYTGGGSVYENEIMYTAPSDKNVKLQFTSWTAANFVDANDSYLYRVGLYVVLTTGEEVMQDVYVAPSTTTYNQTTLYPAGSNLYNNGTTTSNQVSVKSDFTNDIVVSQTVGNAAGFSLSELYLKPNEKLKVYFRNDNNYPYSFIWRGLLIEEDVAS